jgi:tripartite-type tricarboxylate transporter receptor subunit TctC
VKTRIGLFSALLLSSGICLAQYPNKAITSVVGFAPGGGTDTVSRIVGKTLGDQVGQQVLTDNKAGAGGNIATDLVVRSAPDGYTLYLANVGAIAVNPHLLPLTYDPLRDLAPITMAVVFPNLVVVHPTVPANTLAELIKLARENPGKYTYGSSGIGGAGHLAGELLKMMAKVDLVHVPFKGGGPAMQAMLGGQIHSYFATPVAAGPHVRAGKVRALAVTGATRSRLLPELPTIGEAGLFGYNASGWYGFVVPAAAPKNIVARLTTEINRTLRLPEVIERLSGQGAEPAGNTPEQFGAFMRAEIDKWAQLVKTANMKAD